MTQLGRIGGRMLWTPRLHCRCDRRTSATCACSLNERLLQMGTSSMCLFIILYFILSFYSLFFSSFFLFLPLFSFSLLLLVFRLSCGCSRLLLCVFIF